MERTSSSVEGMDCSRAARITTTRLPQSSGSGFGSKSVRKINPTPAPSPSSYEMFELQELRAQLQTILKQNILIQSLSKEKRQELSEYVKAVVEKVDSPIDFSGRRGNGNTMGTAKFVAAVEGKSWRLIFSTDGNSSTTSSGEGGADATEGALPYGSSVILRIGQFMGTEGTLDYVLKYSKQIMGLKELVAKSICSVDIGPVNPGLFTYQYKDIKTNVFGISNLPVGFFGLLKGRVNYIDTVWFDGERWIERNYLENGDVVYSVYVRDIEDEKEQTK
ncbi:hypothetical protein ACHAW5_002203 [Stephanodiscus triporus]|uniref:Plastid lipid-associated protein/fibrillin conserved domain-containing protein n=1 Tax=Stephanodiscus triporus TaxID=2934178 RepID=A0ABD3P5I5_9STRA